MNREVHVRFWEQPEVQSLRLTRLTKLSSTVGSGGGLAVD
jgi:hypothetical protein